MKLSDKMPAQQDSTLAARMPAKMDSDAPAYKGEGGSDDPADSPIAQKSTGGVDWQSINEKGESWQTADKKTGPGDGYSLQDRKETDTGGLPQRDPDNDGDLN